MNTLLSVVSAAAIALSLVTVYEVDRLSTMAAKYASGTPDIPSCELQWLQGIRPEWRCRR